jgi:hypothetical protein
MLSYLVRILAVAWDISTNLYEKRKAITHGYSHILNPKEKIEENIL